MARSVSKYFLKLLASSSLASSNVRLKVGLSCCKARQLDQQTTGIVYLQHTQGVGQPTVIPHTSPHPLEFRTAGGELAGNISLIIRGGGRDSPQTSC